MRFIVHLKLTYWAVRKRAGEPLAADRVRRDLVGVELFQYLMPVHKLTEKSTARTLSRLWNVIDEALEPTGRVMR